jgi:hypothetical protein
MIASTISSRTPVSSRAVDAPQTTSRSAAGNVIMMKNATCAASLVPAVSTTDSTPWRIRNQARPGARFMG